MKPNLRHFSLFVLCITTVILFQNCGNLIGYGGNTNDLLNGQSQASTCHPSNDCLHYSLITYGTQECLGGYNKAKIDNEPSQNGAVTDVHWDKCLLGTNGEACCPTGVITASFSTVSGDRSISISFDNSPTAFFNISR